MVISTETNGFLLDYVRAAVSVRGSSDPLSLPLKVETADAVAAATKPTRSFAAPDYGERRMGRD
jgi:hypothetical protein